MPTIWHNPRCSKSRETLKLLQELGQQPTIRLYLEDPPSAAEIQDALARLGIPPRALVRRSEEAFKAQGLKDADDATLIAAMAAEPKLIERPVVFVGPKAALGRPPEAVRALFEP
ncbi:MAG: arsenate reductase (glutaredoxin) [bacterium]